jgi:hypothetical protein
VGWGEEMEEGWVGVGWGPDVAVAPGFNLITSQLVQLCKFGNLGRNQRVNMYRKCWVILGRHQRSSLSAVFASLSTVRNTCICTDK